MNKAEFLTKWLKENRGQNYALDGEDDEFNELDAFDIMQQYADEVSRERAEKAFNNARLRIGPDRWQFQYSTYKDWLKDQEEQP